MEVEYIFMVGAMRPGLDHDKKHWNTNDAYFIHADDGALHGNGKSFADEQGRFAEGDRVGVLLDLDAGWIRVYRNGRRCGPGFGLHGGRDGAAGACRTRCARGRHGHGAAWCSGSRGGGGSGRAVGGGAKF